MASPSDAVRAARAQVEKTFGEVNPVGAVPRAWSKTSLTWNDPVRAEVESTLWRPMLVKAQQLCSGLDDVARLCDAIGADAG